MKKLFKRVSVLFAALMALSVSTVRPVEEVKAAEIVDTLDNAFTGVGSSTSYKDWSGKTGVSGAVYKGQSAGDSGTIQLRSKNSNSGIVTTTSGGIVSKVEVTWNSKTSAGRTLDIYGSDTAYSAASDLYNSTKQGKKLGSIVCGTSTSLTISDEYAYVGMRSNNNAMYLTNINITWTVPDAGGDDEPATDADLVTDGLKSVKKLINEFYGESIDVELPATDENGVNYTYGLSEHNENYYSIDEDGIFTTNPTNKLESAKLTITASKGEATEVAEITINSLQKNSTLTIADAVVAAKYFGGSYSVDKYYIVADIVQVYNTTYGNLYVNDGTTTSNFTVYGLYSADGKTRYDAMATKPIAGDTVKLYSVLGTYNGTAQMKDAWLTEHTINKTNEELIAMEETKFSLSFDYGLTYRTEESDSVPTEETVNFSEQGYENGKSVKDYSGESFRLAFASGGNTNASMYYDSGTAIRMYAKNTMTVSSDSTITKIVITFGSSDGSNSITVDTGTFTTNTWTGEANEVTFTIAGTSGNRRFAKLAVTTGSTSGTVEVLDKASFANVNLAFGASVDADLFEGYTSVNGGILLENAAKYTETTLAEAYKNGTFEGRKSSKENLTSADGFYTVGTVVEIINGLVNEENEKFLSYEFVAAAYFELVDAEGNVTTVVLEQKVYSVKSMVEYYNDNLSALGIEDENVIKALGAFEDYLA